MRSRLRDLYGDLADIETLTPAEFCARAIEALSLNDHGECDLAKQALIATAAALESHVEIAAAPIFSLKNRRKIEEFNEIMRSEPFQRPRVQAWFQSFGV